MSALPPDDMRNLRQTAFAARHPLDAMVANWQAIADQSSRLAAMAQLAHDGSTEALPSFVAALGHAADWQRELAWQSVEDMTAMLGAGMAALDVLASRGVDSRTPALALWREVDAARRAVMAMLTIVASSETPTAATA